MAQDIAIEVANGITSITQGVGVLLNPSPITNTGSVAAALGGIVTKSLKITCAGGGSTVVITADAALLADSSNQTILLTTVSVTPNIALASGAGSIDTGSVAANTWYFVWLIAKSDGTTSAIFSLSSTAPNMPTGYTFKLLVGANRTDGSSHTTVMTQLGPNVWIAETQVFSSQAGSVTYVSQSVSTIVPITARVLFGAHGCNAASTLSTAIAGDSSGTGACSRPDASANQTVPNEINGWFGNQQYRIPLISTQTFYWKAQDTSASYMVTVTGWQITTSLG